MAGVPEKDGGDRVNPDKHIIDVKESRATLTSKGYLLKGELQWRCGFCGKRNKTKRGMRMHLRRKHEVTA